MSRPKSENALGPNIHVRLPVEIQAAYQKEADSKSLPLSTYIRLILIEKLKP